MDETSAPLGKPGTSQSRAKVLANIPEDPPDYSLKKEHGDVIQSQYGTTYLTRVKLRDPIRYIDEKLSKDAGGRPREIDWEQLAHHVLEQVAEGNSLTEAIKQFNVNPFHAFVMLNHAVEWFPKWLELSHHVRIEFWITELDKLAKDATAEDWQVQRLRIDTRKWLIERLNPRKYGVKQQVEVSGEVKVTPSISISLAPPKQEAIDITDESDDR